MNFEYTYKKNGKKLYLHRRIAANKVSFMWFFSGEQKDSVDLPEHLEVGENPYSGYPFIRKKKPFGSA